MSGRHWPWLRSQIRLPVAASFINKTYARSHRQGFAEHESAISSRIRKSPAMGVEIYRGGYVNLNVRKGDRNKLCSRIRDNYVLMTCLELIVSINISINSRYSMLGIYIQYSRAYFDMQLPDYYTVLFLHWLLGNRWNRLKMYAISWKRFHTSKHHEEFNFLLL